jgi:hypothetical protein
MLPKRTGIAQGYVVPRNSWYGLTFRRNEATPMSIILLTWELGGGLGHLVNLLPLARGLSQRGNRVFAAIKTGRNARVGYSMLPTSVGPRVVLQILPKTTTMKCI